MTTARRPVPHFAQQPALSRLSLGVRRRDRRSGQCLERREAMMMHIRPLTARDLTMADRIIGVALMAIALIEVASFFKGP